MEAYLEAIDVGVLRATTQGFPKPKDLANPIGDEAIMRSGMQRPKILSLEAFARMSLTVSETTKTPMHYGRIFVRSMREPRVSVRNAITL
jgi:hypothetical protein